MNRTGFAGQPPCARVPPAASTVAAPAACAIKARRPNHDRCRIRRFPLPE
jgi:hypothetical protein